MAELIFDPDADEAPCEIEIERVVCTTDGALLVASDGFEFWVPRSVVDGGGDVGPDAAQGEQGTMLIARWWARQRGLEP